MSPLYRWRSGSWRQLGIPSTSGGGTTNPPTGGGGTTDPGTGGGTTTMQVGALPIGTTSYAVPSNAKYVSTTGLNSNTGSLSSPVQTLGRVCQVAAAGDTWVFRGGDYRLDGKSLGQLGNGNTTANVLSAQGVTLMAAPGEAVWFDGSVTVTGWTLEGGLYWAPWEPRRRDMRNDAAISSDSVYAQCIANNDFSVLDAKDPNGNTANDKYWQFVDQTDPFRRCASQPERLWVDGLQYVMTDDKSTLAAGIFWIDLKQNRVYLSENPTGKKIEMSKDQKLLNFLGFDHAFLGIGIRRFAPSMPMGGVITTHRGRPRFENVWIKDVGAAAIKMSGSANGVSPYDWSVTKCTIERAGNVGVDGTSSDRGLWAQNKVINCNDRLFNPAPSAGGVKLTRVNDITIRDNIFDCLDNTDASQGQHIGHGKLLWYDQDCRRLNTYRNKFLNSGQRSVVYEISCDIVHVSNFHSGSGTDALAPVDSNRVTIWWNTFQGGGRNRNKPETVITDTFSNCRPINMQRDTRQPRGPGPKTGYTATRYYTTQDASIPVPLEPYPEDGWTPDVYSIGGNIITDNDGQCYVADEQLGKSTNPYSVYKYHRVIDGNLYQPKISGGTTSIPWTWTDEAVSGFQASAATITALRTSAVGWEKNGQFFAASVGRITDDAGQLKDSSLHASALPAPDVVTSLLGVQSGTKRFGPLPDATTGSTVAAHTARLLAGTITNPARLIAFGDSITFGASYYGASSPKYLNSYLGQERTKIAAKYGDAGTGWVLFNQQLYPPNAAPFSSTNPNNAAWDDRMVFTGTLSEPQQGLFGHGAIGIPDGGSSPSNYVTLTAKCSEFWLLLLPGSTGVVRYSIDGGTSKTGQNTRAAQTVDTARENGGSAQHVWLKISAGTLGTHSLKFWGDGATITALAWAAPVYQGRIVVDTAAISGESYKTLFNATITGRDALAYVDTFDPDVAFLMLGANDYNGAVPLSDCLANLTKMINKVVAIGAIPLVGFPPQSSPTLYPGGTANTYTEYVNGYASTCANLGVPFLNLQKLWAPNATTEQSIYDTGRALSPARYADTIHPTDAGGADIATALHTFLGL